MNPILREEIVKHVLSNLGVIPSEFVSQQKSKSLINKEYLLSEHLLFEDAEGEVTQNKIWGCQMSAESQEIKILLGDCSQDSYVPEYCLLVQLKDSPAYGMYLVYDGLVGHRISSECMLAYSVDSKSWMECGTFLQATFLAGMEQVKDVGFGWNKCTNYQSQYQAMLSFIKFHSSIYEVDDEGQED